MDGNVWTFWLLGRARGSDGLRGWGWGWAELDWARLWAFAW